MASTRGSRGTLSRPGGVGGMEEMTSRLPSGLTVAPPYRSASAPRTAGQSFLDPSQTLFWRTVFVGGAAAYLGLFHLTIGGVISAGRSGPAPHTHPMGMALYLASWLVLIDAARDVISYAFPHYAVARALHEAV